MVRVKQSARWYQDMVPVHKNVKKHPHKENKGDQEGRVTRGMMAIKQMQDVIADPWALEKIDLPSEKLQLAAVRNNGCVVRCIKSPSEAVQLAAVRNCGSVIEACYLPMTQVCAHRFR